MILHLNLLKDLLKIIVLFILLPNGPVFEKIKSFNNESRIEIRLLFFNCLTIKQNSSSTLSSRPAVALAGLLSSLSSTVNSKTHFAEGISPIF